ncbi:MAG: hypothetical protein PWQ79_1808 [Thermococcaceae archaeon]|nr:hypothetical protein [Thermococcaceae archaeon]MDK2914893.1 hypothetical protein [Thermococcaceae archaeon]
MKEVIIITDPETVKVLSEETRFRILQLLRLRPMTIKELADAIGKDRSTISRHIKALENAGLVEEFEAFGNEKVYSRSARLFLIKPDPDESVERFRQAYLQLEAEKIVNILERAGFTIKDRRSLKKIIKEVFDQVEIKSQPILKRISLADVELTEVELFHLLNILVFLQSCELCEHAKKVRELIIF